MSPWTLLANSRRMLLLGVVCLALVLQQGTGFLPSCHSPSSLSFFSKKPQLRDARRTELCMGLRSFLKKKVGAGLGRNDERGDANRSAGASINKPTPVTNKAQKKKTKNGATVLTTKTAARELQHQPISLATPKKVRMGTDPKTGEIDVAMQLGPETVQERIHRIKRGEMSNAEKEAFLKSALSTGTTPESRLPMLSGSSGSSTKSASASPFPTDSILRNMAMGSKVGAEGEEAPRTPQIDSQSKKQQYLDMVTNPSRFKTYQNAGAAVVDSVVVVSDTTAVPNIPKDLGARLGAAAMENEKRKEEVRLLRVEQEQDIERQRQERERRLAEATRHRQEELAKHEVEILKQKQVEDSDTKRKLDKQKIEEEAKRAGMMRAQDDYWTRKLAADKNAVESKIQKEQQPKPEVVELMKEVIEVSVDIMAGEDSPEDFEIKEVPKAEQLVTDFLNDATLSRFSNNDMINRAASEVFGRPPLNDVIGRAPLNDTTNRVSILDDATRNKSERKQQQDNQLERLRSLNSPLPGSGGKAIPRPQGPRKSNFQPQTPVTATRSLAPATSLGSLTKTIQNATGAAKKEDEETKAQPGGSKSKGGFTNPFSRLKKDPVSLATPAVANPVPPAPAIVTPPPLNKPAAPRRAGPIRMELPLGDKEDEDEEGAMTEGMTIGEIMKRQEDSGSANQGKRSKQWGVDMSRFQD